MKRKGNREENGNRLSDGCMWMGCRTDVIFLLLLFICLSWAGVVENRIVILFFSPAGKSNFAAIPRTKTRYISLVKRVEHSSILLWLELILSHFKCDNGSLTRSSSSLNDETKSFAAFPFKHTLGITDWSHCFICLIINWVCVRTKLSEREHQTKSNHTSNGMNALKGEGEKNIWSSWAMETTSNSHS